MQQFQIITRADCCPKAGTRACLGNRPGAAIAAGAALLFCTAAPAPASPGSEPLDIALAQPLADLPGVLGQLSVAPENRAQRAAVAAQLLAPFPRSSASVSGLSTFSTVVITLRWLKGAGSPDRPSVGTLAETIREASRVTGISSDYLWRTAKRESNLDTYAMSSRSSARGLFQFVENTWLATFAAHGPIWGYDLRAWSAGSGENAPVEVDTEVRRRILHLRYDPVVSTRMAASLAAQNRAELRRRLGRNVSDDEIYLAHLLGVAGAARLLTAAALPSPPSGASLLPSAADANPSLFYIGGRPLSARAVLERIKHG